MTMKGPLEKALERLERENQVLLGRWEAARETALRRVDTKYQAEAAALSIRIDGVRKLLGPALDLEPKGDADAVGN